MVPRADQPADPAYLSSDRLASLSDTMFGVAMTLVVTTLLPAIQAHRGAVSEMAGTMADDLLAVLLSFAVSARYWVSQQQRLAMTRSVTPLQTALHLVFLLLIVLVPISTSLSGLTGPAARRDAVTIYGAHLFALGTVNLLLWLEVHRRVRAKLQITRASVALFFFAAALAVGAMRPSLALYVWLAVFPTQFLIRHLPGRATAKQS